MKLYNFDKLKIHLDDLGFPEVFESRFKIFRKDFSEEEAKGNVIYQTGKIFLKDNNYEYLGYLYIKYPDIEKYGFPKFHIAECSTILQQKQSGAFEGKYYWHNSNTVDLVDRKTLKKYNGQKLILCSNCHKTFSTQYSDSEGFYELLDKDEVIDSKIESTDIFGYVNNWSIISKSIKKKRNYTCEKCNLKISNANDFRFLHVHHKNGNKLQNREVNLQCLCIKCHSEIDEIHSSNFKKNRMQIELKNFSSKYKV